MAVSMLTSIASAASAGISFTDVEPDSTYAEAVEKLAVAGIVKGVGKSKFKPDSTITTAELVTFLGRIDHAKADNTAAVDGIALDGWSTGYMAWAQTASLITEEAQYAALTVEQVNNILSAYCNNVAVADIPTVTNATRGNVAVALATIYATTQITRNVAYINDNSDYHLLDVYDSTGADTKQPLIIEIHGGGLIGGTKETNRAHSNYYAEHGFKVVTPNYTLMPDGDYKTIVQDLFALLEWVGQNADIYNYDTKQVFLSGDSAGGYIVSLLAAVLNTPSLQAYYEVTPPDNCNIKGYVMTCPMADQAELAKGVDGKSSNFLNNMIFAPKIGADILKNKDIMDHVLLTEIVDPETYPEVYIIATPENDPYYPDAQMFKALLDENDIPNVYQEYTSHKLENGHVFNAENDTIENPVSIKANDDAIKYMMQKCAE